MYSSAPLWLLVVFASYKRAAADTVENAQKFSGVSDNILSRVLTTTSSCLSVGHPEPHQTSAPVALGLPAGVTEGDGQHEVRQHGGAPDSLQAPQHVV